MHEGSPLKAKSNVLHMHVDTHIIGTTVIYLMPVKYFFTSPFICPPVLKREDSFWGNSKSFQININDSDYILNDIILPFVSAWNDREYDYLDVDVKNIPSSFLPVLNWKNVISRMRWGGLLFLPVHLQWAIPVPRCCRHDYRFSQRTRVKIGY